MVLRLELTVISVTLTLKFWLLVKLRLLRLALKSLRLRLWLLRLWLELLILRFWL